MALLKVNQRLITETVKFNDGNKIPMVGLGTFLPSRAGKYFRTNDQISNLTPSQIEQDRLDDIKEEKEFTDAVIVAIKHGYRHIDTAQVYRTEVVIGNALQALFTQNIVSRNELFVTTKVSETIRNLDSVRQCIEDSLRDLQLDYIDLFLVHRPYTQNPIGSRGHDVIEQYKILHEYRKRGKINSVGVSNFGIKHLQILEAACPDLPLPVCNQIECTPFNQELELFDYCHKKGILIQSYSPIGQAKEQIRNNKILNELARKYNVTWGQIMLRWQVQKGFVLLPKSVTPKRIIENGNVFGFHISQQDMDKLDELKEIKFSVCPNSLKEPWDDNYKVTLRSRL